MENKPKSSLVVSLGKAFNGTPPPLCERQLASTLRKWQLPSECGRPVQNIAIAYNLLSREWRINMNNTKNQERRPEFCQISLLMVDGRELDIDRVFCSNKAIF